MHAYEVGEMLVRAVGLSESRSRTTPNSWYCFRGTLQQQAVTQHREVARVSQLVLGKVYFGQQSKVEAAAHPSISAYELRYLYREYKFFPTSCTIAVANTY